jgi:hypothetical protein
MVFTPRTDMKAKKLPHADPARPAVPARRSKRDRAVRPLPEVGQTDALPDAGASEPARENPTTGVASHGSSTSRKI